MLAEKLRYAISNCRSIDMDNYMLARNADNDHMSDEEVIIWTVTLDNVPCHNKGEIIVVLFFFCNNNWGVVHVYQYPCSRFHFKTEICLIKYFNLQIFLVSNTKMQYCISVYKWKCETWLFSVVIFILTMFWYISISKQTKKIAAIWQHISHWPSCNMYLPHSHYVYISLLTQRVVL